MNRPYTIINCAASVDGKIALVGKKPLKISNKDDIARVHHLRNECDGILVGIGTVLADNPKLTVKEDYVNEIKQPLRIILDSKYRTPITAEVMKPTTNTLIVTTCKSFKKGHLEVVKCGTNKVDLYKLMDFLYNRQIKKLLVEGGSRVIWEFLTKKLVDEILIFYSPLIIGGSAPNIVGGEGVKEERDLIRLSIVNIEQIGEGYLIKLTLKHEQ